MAAKSGGIVTLASLALLSASLNCVQAPDNVSVYVIGDVSEATLGSSIQSNWVTTQHDGSSTDRPILMHGPQLNSLSDQQKATIKQTWSNNKPVLLLDPSSEHVAQLLDIVDSQHQHSLPENVAKAEVFAHVKNPEGSYAQLTSYVIVSQGAQDSAASRAQRAATLQSRLRGNLLAQSAAQSASATEAQFTTPEVLAQTSGSDTCTTTSTNLACVAATFVDTADFSVILPENDGYTNRGGTLKGGTNTNTLTHFYTAVHDHNTGNDWFIVKQVGQFAPGPAYQNKGPHLEGYYARYYEINNYLDDNLGIQEVRLISHTPATTTGVTTTTSAMSYSFGGNVSVIGGLQASANYSSSTTIQTPDVTIFNTSLGQRGNNATWTYQMPYATFHNDSCDNTMDHPMSIKSTDTYDVTNQWLWMVTPAGREKTPDNLKVNVQGIFNYAVSWIYHTGSHCNSSGCACDHGNDDNINGLSHSFTLDYVTLD